MLPSFHVCRYPASPSPTLPCWLQVRESKPGSSRADFEEARAAARAHQGLEPDSDEELALGSSGSSLARRRVLGQGGGGAEVRRVRRTAGVVRGGMMDDGSYVGPGGGERILLREAAAAAAAVAVHATSMHAAERSVALCAYASARMRTSGGLNALFCPC